MIVSYQTGQTEIETTKLRPDVMPDSKSDSRSDSRPDAIKDQLRRLILSAAGRAHKAGYLPSGDFPPVEIERPKAAAHGDFATNMAMLMARAQKMAPRRIAEILAAHMDDPGAMIKKTDIAGPGFINMTLNPAAWRSFLSGIHGAGDDFGRSHMGRGKKAQVEFVSANPTGPLHIGHGRGAAVGDAVASILSFCGYEVQREYYINDSGRQIRTLGRSVRLRLCEAAGRPVDFPGDAYQGDYIRDLAAGLRAEKGEELLDMPEEQGEEICARYAAGVILSGIRRDLEDFGVRFDRWFSEQSLYDEGRVDAAIAELRDRSLTYEKEGALWFRTTDASLGSGDEKDRVIVRANGMTTYFASDIAYHREKYERGFDRVIDVWGADHHGYIPRIRAAIGAAGRDQADFDVILIQLVNLLRDGAPVAMSSRAGEFVTLREVVDEVGSDAARFFFLTRHYESRLDFDLDLARRKSNDNPVFYVQYVHARIAAMQEKAVERELIPAAEDPAASTPDLSRLDTDDDLGLIRTLSRYPEAVEAAGRMLEPHRVTYYLTELAAAFHAYYNKRRVLTDDPDESRARLYLMLAVKRVIASGLHLLGVSSPERM